MIGTELEALRNIDKATQELRDRNALRAEEMKKEMGKRHLLHPSNSPKKSKYRKVLKAV